MAGQTTWPLRVAIVGLGQMVVDRTTPRLDDWRRWTLPYRHAHAIAMSPIVDLVAACDLDQNRIDIFLTIWKDTFPRVRTYRDMHTMFREQEFDIVVVSTPEDKHAAVVEAAAAAGVSAILCEKPIATTLVDAQRIIDATRQVGCVLSVNYSRRWDPFYYRAKEMIQAGMLGDVATIVGTCSGSQAMMFRHGTHMIDLMNFYAGAQPVRVFGLLDADFEHYVRYIGEGRHKDPDADPGASGIVIYANGVRGFYNGSKGTYGANTPSMGQEIDISGSKGRIRISDTVAEFWTYEQGTGAPVRRTYPAVFTARSATESAIEDLVRAVSDGGQTRCTGSEARETLAVMIGILESHRLGGRRVPVDPG